MGVFDYICEGQMNFFDLLNGKAERYVIDKPIKLIELFGGIGSQAQSLKNLGANFTHHKLVEYDKYPVASYNSIHNTDFVPLDITKISGEDLEITDTDNYCYVLCYSFPCQDLSLAGKLRGMEEGSGTRSSLLFEVKRLLNETKKLPQVLLMENVPNVHGKSNMDSFQTWIDFLESKGYSNYWQDLNAKDYGVPQSRNRCFMVSILGNYSYEFPKPFELEYVMKDYLEPVVDEKYYLSNEKARDLIEKLIEGGKINTQGCETINPMEDGTCRTIKNQYHFTSTVNLEKQGTFGASGAIRVDQLED